MLKTRGYATNAPTAKLGPFEFERREPGARDVLIDIAYCGICHSDIHQARDEWEGSTYPMVPGHEIVGRVARVGHEVSRFKVGDLAGVGCFVDSCRECASCRAGLEQHCKVHTAFTYNSTQMDETTPTYGGYSSRIVVDEDYALHVPENIPLAGAAPLLCAGITTYSPMRRFRVGPGTKVGIVGLGGLGHVGVKIAAALGADVTVFSTSKSKEKDARALGAHRFVVSKDPDAMASLSETFDFILDTVSAPHDVNVYLELLRLEGAMVVVGLPTEPLSVDAFQLVGKRLTLTGSNIGGIEETQEMLDFCAEKGITAEVIPPARINEAYDRTVKADVRYRFVIDMANL